MSAPVTPPEIPGLTFVRKLGSGGYADVYLYDQAMPARQVAVKVMRETSLSSAAAEQFRAEANAMARLEHPHIVPVYSVGRTTGGRQFIVMMYYPRASYAERAKQERLPVAEVLRVGIQIGSALETAHRAGLLHRDIKPANILTDKYGNPGLTDFGIAAQTSTDRDADTGVSVPWSPPEILYATAAASVRSDVYSLAATLWHLLVGRSPFEITGGDNSHFALMRRIRDLPPPSTGRPDVPASLDNLLRAAMAPNPAARPASMLTFVRSLQGIEQELRYPRTPIVLADEQTVEPAPAAPADDKTRMRPATLAGAQAAALPRVGAVPAAAANPAAPPEPTRLRQVAEQVQAPEVPELGPSRPRWWIAVVAVVVIAVIVGVGVWLMQGQTKAVDPPSPSPTTTSPPPLGDGAPPGKIVFATPERKGDKITISWTYEYPEAGDTFSWRWSDQTTANPPLTKPTITLAASEAKKDRCFEVKVVRANGTMPDPFYASKCF